MIFIVLIHACTNQVPGAVNKALRGSVNMELIFGLDKEKKKPNRIIRDYDKCYKENE